MSITVQIDEDTAIEMLVDRVKYWTDDSDTIELFEEYYTNMVEGGCFDGGEFNVMAIVDNDYVNNTSITTREEYESDREDFLRSNIKEWIEDNKDYYEDHAEYVEALKDAIEDFKSEAPEFEDLEIGTINCEFLSGYYIEAKTDNALLITY